MQTHGSGKSESISLPTALFFCIQHYRLLRDPTNSLSSAHTTETKNSEKKTFPPWSLAESPCLHLDNLAERSCWGLRGQNHSYRLSVYIDIGTCPLLIPQPLISLLYYLWWIHLKFVTFFTKNTIKNAIIWIPGSRGENRIPILQERIYRRKKLHLHYSPLTSQCTGSRKIPQYFHIQTVWDYLEMWLF